MNPMTKKTSKRLTSAIISTLLLFSVLFSLTSCLTVKESKTSETTTTTNINYNSKLLTDNNKKLENIPDGYIGIYTINDLNNVRYQADKKYILMNDLSFTDSDFAEGGAFEGGWIAIPGFSGIFNGNGHVIKNLVLNTQADEFIGLFGETIVQQSTYLSDGTYAPLTYRSGFIYNLGIDNVKADMKINPDENTGEITLGAVAAISQNIYGCYAENVNFTIAVSEKTGDTSTTDSTLIPEMNIGLLCGRAQLIDSCYATGKIALNDSNSILTANNLKLNNVYISGLCSFAFSAVTSYFSADATVNGDNTQLSLLGVTTFLPRVSNKDFIDEIANLIKQNSTSSRDSKQFMSFFALRRLDADRQDFLLTSTNSDSDYYLLEPAITAREIERLENFCTKYAYSQEEMRRKVSEMSLKVGEMTCYTTISGKTYEQSYFKDFDFENIWVMKDGVPKLKIFNS